MKKPYKINFHSPVLSDQDVEYNLTEHFLYPVSFAHAKQIVIPQGTLLSQYCNTYLTYAELFEIQTEEDFSASVEMLDQQLFLFFMLEGNISTKNDYGREVLNIQGGHFCASYKRKGNYHTRFKTGSHRFLAIAYRPDWSKRIALDYSHLNDLFESFQETEDPYHILPSCKISRPISGLLHRLSKQNTPKTKGELGALMKEFISKILLRYDDLLSFEIAKLSHRAKAYIDIHYANSDLTIEFLIDHLFTTGQTLRENFKKDYNQTPHGYLIAVRMQHAYTLLETENLPIKEVGRLVGYDDAKNFGLQFKKFFGYAPSEVRNR